MVKFRDMALFLLCTCSLFMDMDAQTKFTFQHPIKVSSSAALSVDAVTTTPGTSSSGTTCSVNLTIASDANHLVVGVSEDNYTADIYVTGVTAGGVAMTEFIKKYEQQGGDSAEYAGIWELHNPPTGTVTITATSQSSTGTMIVGGISFKNAASGLTGGNSGGNPTSGSSASVIEGSNTHSWSLSVGTFGWSMVTATMTGSSSGTITVGVVETLEDNDITKTDGYTTAWEIDDSVLGGICSGGCTYH